MPISAEREIFEVDEIVPLKRLRVKEPNLYKDDLSFAGHDSQYSLHALHPYVAAINPPLVKKLIETYVPKTENILDPFCGGGGVLLEATLHGNTSAGGDVNPLSIILSKAKTTYIDQRKLQKAFIQIIELAEKPNTKSIEVHPQLEFWFKNDSIPFINSLINSINIVTENDLELNNLFKAIFSATVRDVMLTYRGEVRLRKLRDEDLNKFNPDVLRSFAKRYKIAYERIITLPIDSTASDIAIRDIKKMDFEDESFHSIICSPPYADDKNGVGYFQFSKNMLEWLGYSKEEINNHKKLFLGASKELNSLPKSESLEQSLENVAKRNSNNHYKEAVSFYHDYNLGLLEISRVIRKNIIIVIGNRVLSRTQFDNAQITVDFLKNIGIDLKHHYTRELRKKRIANMGGDGGGIAKEHILIFEKKTI